MRCGERNAPDVEEAGDAARAEAGLEAAEEGLVRLEVEPVDARVRQARPGAQPARRRRIAAEERVLPPRHGGRLLRRRWRGQRDEAGGGEDGLQLVVGQDGPERGAVPQGQLLGHLLDGHPQLAAVPASPGAGAGAGRRGHEGFCTGFMVGGGGQGRRLFGVVYVRDRGLFRITGEKNGKFKRERGAEGGGGDRGGGMHWDSLGVAIFLKRLGAVTNACRTTTPCNCFANCVTVRWGLSPPVLDILSLV